MVWIIDAKPVEGLYRDVMYKIKFSILRIAQLELTENKVLSHRVVFRRKIVSRCNVQVQVLDI